MAKYSIEDTTLTNIADAIRTKTGSSSSIMVQDMASEIAGIKGEPTLQTKTVTPSTSSQTITPDSGYGGLSQVTVNAMPTATQATPSITVSSGGLITAKATQSAGYVASGTKQATKQLTVQAAKTITPTKSAQTAVASGRYTTGAVTVAAIPDTYIQPSGTLEVTENGTHDVKNYASVNVNVAGSGGGSGGGEPATCTVTINSFDANIRTLQYSTYINGIYEWHDELLNPEVSSITLDNVLCGGCVTQYNSFSFCFNVPNNENYVYFENGYNGFYLVPTGDITITIIDDD